MEATDTNDEVGNNHQSSRKREIRDDKKQLLLQKVALKGNEDLREARNFNVEKVASMKIKRLSSRLSSIASSSKFNQDDSFEKEISDLKNDQSIKVRDQSDENKSSSDSQFERDDEPIDINRPSLLLQDSTISPANNLKPSLSTIVTPSTQGQFNQKKTGPQLVKYQSIKKKQHPPRNKVMVNSLSKEDYSFFYDNSVWDQYEDFVYAIQRGRYDQAIQIYRDDGITVDEVLRPSGDTVLHVCAEYGQDELFKYFLGEPNAKVNCKNFVDETPLHLAAREGKLSMLSLLITQFKVDLEQDTVDGWSAITYAAFNGFQQCVELLHKNGAKLNHQDRLQRTPLHWAARCNQSDMAINLMKLGVEFELQDFESKRAVEVATDNGYTVLASSITQHHQFAEKKKKLMKLQS